ncbi:MAG: GNAT family N-acetyltransferase [Promethearchaeota archaeon]
MKIEHAQIEDLPEILELQNIAFRSQAMIYNDFKIPPLIQTLEEIRQDFLNQTYLKAVIDDKIIGSVRGYEEEGICYIGRLMVHPDFHNNGIGTKLMYKIEEFFNKTKRYELFTGHKSERNLYLYQKLGYNKFKMEKINNNLNMVYLEKVNEELK